MCYRGAKKLQTLGDLLLDIERDGSLSGLRILDEAIYIDIPIVTKLPGDIQGQWPSVKLPIANHLKAEKT